MRYLFIGESRSNRAIQMNVTWESGALAAKTLFEALKNINIDPYKQFYINLFEPLKDQGIRYYKKHTSFILHCKVIDGFKVVGMGNKVCKELDKMNISHIKIIHPAARGKIRKKENYFNHIKEKLL